MTRRKNIRRRRLLVNGIVQGVGFRPFVFNLAGEGNLSGFVTNTSEGVVIEIQGPAPELDLFARRLREQTPPLASIVSVTESESPPIPGDDCFIIRPSENLPGTSTFIPPDVATCPDCRREILDPADRRYGYPFTNCTNCGPRWTIIGRIPYDRPFTSMADFHMCPACQREYDDPRNRRFHAQPNACPRCGPRAWLTGPDGAPLRNGADADGDPLAGAAELLATGKIVAVKGLGGFHLAVRADDEAAVARLRQRKGREAKPLAVMTAGLDTARALARISPGEAELLAGPAAPIVLLEKLPDAALAAAVCPGHRRVGVMLAYTPLHILLLEALAARGVGALVMTSGNLGEEPICLDNDEALARLGNIADAWLLHDRRILRRADDSVVQVLPGGLHFFRRSRGFAPVPVLLANQPEDGPVVLAVGPELKNTICLLKENRAFLSPHVGDLANLEANRFFQETVATLQEVLECTPDIIAHDLHPDYFSTRFARQQTGTVLVAVQHHHAHMAAVMAEHGLAGPVIGLIMDGTGYGTDGTIWGGEILVGNTHRFDRFAHLEQVPLPGGDAAVKEPWRMAVSHLRGALGDDPAAWPDLPFLAHRPVDQLLEILARGVNSPLTSSCGRLFDAAAALTGRWSEVHYEAQAASEFMALTTAEMVAAARPFDLTGPAITGSGPAILPAGPLITAVARAVAGGTSPATISTRFHRTLADLLTRAALLAHRETGLSTVVLAGGVFQNEILTRTMMTALEQAGLRPFRPELCPANDGGVALGQAVIARACQH